MGSENSNNDSRANLFPILLLVLLTTGTLIGPLTSSRPNDPEHSKAVLTDKRKIEARLWQDPIAVVERHINESKNNPSKKHPQIDSLKKDIENSGATVNIVAVSVSGDSYSEALEYHRRHRFAVVSALSNYGYSPRDSEIINYFHDTSAISEEVDVPYEWFDSDERKSILVLWLNEHKITKEKYRDFLVKLIKELKQQAKDNQNFNFKLIGPTGTSMLTELMNKDPITNDLNRTIEFKIISPSATISDCDLLNELEGKKLRKEDCLDDAKQKLKQKFENRSIIRSIGTDDNLAKALIWELWQRGVNRERSFFNSPLKKRHCGDGLVLINEVDSLYARTLSRHLSKNDFWEYCEGGSKVRNFNYLRGLDGKLPDIDKRDNNAQSKDDKKESQNSLTQLDDAPPEHAEGRSQFDYLRRLSDTIEQLDQDKNFAENGIKAIGIIGTDVYDKLLILQALRSRFNDKIFFTTDLDARYLHADQTKWARNLVVASNFDLTLNPELQDSTMPFRDSYQTSMYFAMLLALQEHTANHEYDWNKKLDQILKPQIFEIGRTQAVHLASPDGLNLKSPDGLNLKEWIKNVRNPDIKFETSESGECGNNNLKSCTTIEPTRSQLINPLEISKYFGFIVGGVIFILFIYYSYAIKGIVQTWRNILVSTDHRKRWEISGYLLLVVLSIVCFFTLILIDNSSSHFEGEPFIWSEGISVWPNLTIRFSGILLILIYIGIRYRRMLNESDCIRKDFDLASPPRESDERKWQDAVLEGSHFVLTAQSSYRNKNKNVEGNDKKESNKKNIAIDTLWERYLCFTHFSQMLGWIGTATIIAVVFTCLIFHYFDPLHFSYRGNITFYMHRFFALLQFSILWGLIFWAGYELSACRNFVNNLCDACHMKPEKLPKIGVSTKYLDHYTRFRWVVRATERINWLIYQPFILILIIVVGRSTIFDALGLPPSLIIVFIFACIYLAHMMIRLRQCADKVRAATLTYYEELQLKLSHSWLPNDEKQINWIIERVRNTREGVFVSLSNQPVLKAVLLPAGGIGGIQIIEYLFSK